MNEMNITSAQYEPGNYMIKIVLDDGESMSVPSSEGNRHYDEIMRQVAAGKLTIADADPVPDAE